MRNKADLKLTSKPKRNYQFVQFLLDLFALLMLYLVIASIIYDIGEILEYNKKYMPASDELHGNPYPLIVWGVFAVLVYIAGIVLPFVYRARTRLTQKQFDMWVYAVLLIRILAYVMLFFIMGVHFDLIMRRPDSVISSQTIFEILGSAVLIIVLVRFTQIRIRAAEPESETAADTPRQIMED
jgi:hypothetical protein